MIILVCGGREYNDYEHIDRCLTHLTTEKQVDIIVHGGARGADLLAAHWAVNRGIHTAQVNALWNFYGKVAGMKRNVIMTLFEPELCVAFRGGNGTKNMIRLCKKNGIPVWEV